MDDRGRRAGKVRCPFQGHACRLDGHQELWVPADDLPAFNDHIIGRIELTAEFRA